MPGEEGIPISSTEKLIRMGISPRIVADKVAKLRISPDLATLKDNIKETSLSVEQFLGLLFKYLYPKNQEVQQRVAAELQDFNLSSEMLNTLFTSGEPFIVFYGTYGKGAIPEERKAEFQEKVINIMLHELRTFIEE